MLNWKAVRVAAQVTAPGAGFYVIALLKKLAVIVT